MSEEAREKRNEYMREWRKNHPDKVKAARDRYWEKKANGNGVDGEATADR